MPRLRRSQSHPLQGHPVGLARQRKAAQDPVQNRMQRSCILNFSSLLFFIIVSLRDNYFETGSCAKSLRDFHRMTSERMTLEKEVRILNHVWYIPIVL